MPWTLYLNTLCVFHLKIAKYIAHMLSIGNDSITIRFRFFNWKSIWYKVKRSRSIFPVFTKIYFDFFKLKSIFRCSYYIVTPLLFTLTTVPFIRTVSTVIDSMAGHALWARRDAAEQPAAGDTGDGGDEVVNQRRPGGEEWSSKTAGQGNKQALLFIVCNSRIEVIRAGSRHRHRGAMPP